MSDDDVDRCCEQRGEHGWNGRISVGCRMDLGEVESVNNDDDPTSYQGVAELRSAPELTQNELKQVSREDSFCFVKRSLDHSPFVRHDWRWMAEIFSIEQVPV